MKSNCDYCGKEIKGFDINDGYVQCVCGRINKIIKTPNGIKLEAIGW